MRKGTWKKKPQQLSSASEPTKHAMCQCQSESRLRCDVTVLSPGKDKNRNAFMWLIDAIGHVSVVLLLLDPRPMPVVSVIVHNRSIFRLACEQVCFYRVSMCGIGRINAGRSKASLGRNGGGGSGVIRLLGDQRWVLCGGLFGDCGCPNSGRLSLSPNSSFYLRIRSRLLL